MMLKFSTNASLNEPAEMLRTWTVNEPAKMPSGT
jgi:hypothetical protein